MAEFQLYKDKSGDFRWRFVSTNGRIISASSQGSARKTDAVRSIEIMKEQGPEAPFEDQT